MDTARNKRALIPLILIALTLTLSAAMVAALTGCADNSSSPTNSPTSTEIEPTTVPSTEIEQSTVSMGTTAPGSSSPEIFLGIEQGIYETHGLTVEPVLGSGGAALIPALVSGDLDVATGNWVPLLQAVAQGIDLKEVSTAGSTITHGIHGFFVRADSNIKSAADFVDKTLAVNTLGNIGEIAYKEAMTAAGVDPSKATITEVGFPDQSGALERGDIDVAWLPGPFYDLGKANPKFRMVLDFADMPSIKDLPNQGFVGTSKWVDSHPNTVKALSDAIAETVDWMNAHNDAWRAMLVTQSKMTEAMAASATLETHVKSVPSKDIERLVDLMTKWKLLDAPINLDKVLLPDNN